MFSALQSFARNWSVALAVTETSVRMQQKRGRHGLLITSNMLRPSAVLKVAGLATRALLSLPAEEGPPTCQARKDQGKPDTVGLLVHKLKLVGEFRLCYSVYGLRSKPNAVH